MILSRKCDKEWLATVSESQPFEVALLVGVCATRLLCLIRAKILHNLGSEVESTKHCEDHGGRNEDITQGERRSKERPVGKGLTERRADEHYTAPNNIDTRSHKECDHDPSALTKYGDVRKSEPWNYQYHRDDIEGESHR
jgi:hypothetical protein